MTTLANNWQWPWAEEGELSKLLGIFFGLNLDTHDVDHFLYAKVLRS